MKISASFLQKLKKKRERTKKLKKKKMPEKRRERSKLVILSIQETLRRKFNLILSKQDP